MPNVARGAESAETFSESAATESQVFKHSQWPLFPVNQQSGEEGRLVFAAQDDNFTEEILTVKPAG